jgi:hypothetical protein
MTEENPSIKVVKTGMFENGLLPITFEIKVSKFVNFRMEMTGYSKNKDHNEAINYAKDLFAQDLSTFVDLLLTKQL